jgi:hypothetical protein
MEELIKTIFSLNWQTVVGMIVIAWYFTHDIRKVNEEILREIKSMHEDMKVMNTRISRVEGTVYGAQIYKNIGE